MFTTRLVSGIVLILIALVVVGSGGLLLFAATVFISMTGVFELYRVMKIEKKPLINILRVTAPTILCIFRT